MPPSRTGPGLLLLAAAASCSPAAPPKAAQGAPTADIAPPVPATKCAALVSVTLPQRMDLLWGERHVTFQIVVQDGEIRKTPHDGIVVRGPEGLLRLGRVVSGRAGKPFHDIGWDEWGVIGQDGRFVRRIAGHVPPADWMPPSDDDGPVQHHTHLSWSITSVMGPIVSLHSQIYEFRENGVFDPPMLGKFAARDLRTGDVMVWPPELRDIAVRAVNEDMATVDTTTSEWMKPVVPVQPEEGTLPFALAFGAPGVGPITGPPAALTVLSSHCCRREGALSMKRATELASPPGELSSFVMLDPREPSLVRSPNGCASVGLRDQRLTVRVEGEAEARSLPGPPMDRLVAVTWLADAEIDAASALPRAAEPAGHLAYLAYRERATSRFDEGLALLRRAALADPKSALLHRDLGRALVGTAVATVNDDAAKALFAEGTAVLEKALTLGPTKELRASIVYHLGYAAQMSGDRKTAATRYEASIAAHPTRPVKEALEQVRP